MTQLRLPLSSDVRLPVIGDTHGITAWLTRCLNSIKKEMPEVVSIIQVGDFGLAPGPAGAKFLRTVNRTLVKNGQHLFVLLGNHDDYDKHERLSSSSLFPGTKHLNEASNIHLFERQAWFMYGDIKCLAVAGANSINKAVLRSEKSIQGGMILEKNFWDQEQITDEDVENAISGGKVQVMFTHEAPRFAFPLNEAEALVGQTHHPEGVAYAEESAEQLQRIVDVTQPDKLFHGHYHKRSTLRITRGSHTGEYESLGRDGNREGSIVILGPDLKTTPFHL